MPEARAACHAYKRYLDEHREFRCKTFGSTSRVNSAAQERLGYPTQKPVALLERIISASSNPGDIVLDPFCGCGTTVHAAQKLGRQWIGIDITHLAISLIEKRLKDAFPGIKFEVHGAPKDLDGARDLASRDKYQFQWWAVSLVDAVPFGGKKEGRRRRHRRAHLFQAGRKTTEKAIVSVKGGGVGVKDMRELISRGRSRAGEDRRLHLARTAHRADEAGSCRRWPLRGPYRQGAEDRLQIKNPAARAGDRHEGAVR